MAQRRLAYPGTMLQAQNLIQRKQQTFGGGLNTDDPASDIDADESAGLVNFLPFKKYLKGRTGSKEFVLKLPILAPSITGAHYSCYKIDTKVYIIQGIISSDLVEGNYLVWSDGERDQITTIVNPGTGDSYFVSSRSGDKAQDDLCDQQAALWGVKFNNINGKIIVHIGEKLYFTDNTFASYTEIESIGGDTIGDSPSRFDQKKNDLFAYNDSGIYRIIFLSTYAYYFKINSGQPIVRIFEDPKIAEKEFIRNRIYTVSRLIGTNNIFSSRQDAGITIQWESAPVLPDTLHKDASLGYSDLPFGPGSAGTPVDAPQIVCDLNTPSTKVTHYSLYESKDGGEAGEELGNLLDELIWAADIPIIKAMTVTIDGNDNLTVDSDEKILTKEDEGSIFVCGDNGDLFVLDNLTSSLDGTQSYNKNESSADVSAFTDSDSPYSLERTSVPVAIGAKNINRAYQIGNEVFLDKSMVMEWNSFSVAKNDAGKIMFVEDGTTRHILSIEETDPEWAGYKCVVAESIDFGSGVGTPTYLAIAWDPVMRKESYSAEADTKMIVFDNAPGEQGSCFLSRVSGSEFEETDVGKRMVVFVDGVLSKEIITITDFFNKNNIEVLYSGGSESIFYSAGTSITGIILGQYDGAPPIDWCPPRFFNDYITDEELDARTNSPDFLLQTRYFRPLPSSSIGAIAGAFMFIADSDGLAYSEMPATREHIVGHYNPTWQADKAIRDSITFLKEYSGAIVAFGKKSTWGTNTASMGSIKTSDIGEEIFTVPMFTLIDNIGLTHVGSIQDISVGQSIMVCSDAGVRIFNGNQFSANLAENKIHKTLRLWHTNMMSSYDIIGGYIIYGSKYITSDERNYVNMTEGECYRLAVLPSQGNGWTQYSGVMMVCPYQNTGGLNIDEENGIQIQVVLDEITSCWHQINTFNGPAGSGLVESYLDKDDTNIVTSVKGPVHKGDRLSIMLEHMESHCQIEPKDQASDYIAGMTITTRIYSDNLSTLSAETQDTPIDGDVVYDRKINSKYIQNEFEFSASSIILSQIETMYTTRDTAGSTAMDKRPTSESNHQRDYTGI